MVAYKPNYKHTLKRKYLLKKDKRNARNKRERKGHGKVNDRERKVTKKNVTLRKCRERRRKGRKGKSILVSDPAIQVSEAMNKLTAISQ